MKWVFPVVALLLLLGPLRRGFFRNWRFTLPACLTGAVAWVLVSGAKQPGDPWWMPWAVAFFAGLGAGAAGKEWLDQVFGKEK
jgi:hypothetical protein